MPFKLNLVHCRCHLLLFILVICTKFKRFALASFLRKQTFSCLPIRLILLFSYGNVYYCGIYGTLFFGHVFLCSDELRLDFICSTALFSFLSVIFLFKKKIVGFMGKFRFTRKLFVVIKNIQDNLIVLLQKQMS